MGDSNGSQPKLIYQVLYTAILAILYAAAFGAVIFILNPIQAIFLPHVTEFASLVFLPHGLRLIATVVMGLWAIPGLFLGSLYSAYFLWELRDPELLILFTLISSSTAWVVLECLKALGINAFYTSVNQQMPKLDTILLAGVVCSLANSFLMTTVLETGDHIQNTTLIMAAYAIGDTIGLLAAWALANFVLRSVRTPDR